MCKSPRLERSMVFKSPWRIYIQVQLYTTSCVLFVSMHHKLSDCEGSGHSTPEMYSLLLETFIKDSREKDRMFNAIDNIECVGRKAKWAFNWIQRYSYVSVTCNWVDLSYLRVWTYTFILLSSLQFYIFCREINCFRMCGGNLFLGKVFIFSIIPLPQTWIVSAVSDGWW